MAKRKAKPMMEKTVAMWLHRRRYEALLVEHRKEESAAKEKALGI